MTVSTGARPRPLEVVAPLAEREMGDDHRVGMGAA